MTNQYFDEKKYLDSYLKLKKNELKKEKIDWKIAILKKEIDDTKKRIKLSEEK